MFSGSLPRRSTEATAANATFRRLTDFSTRKAPTTRHRHQTRAEIQPLPMNEKKNKYEFFFSPSPGRVLCCTHKSPKPNTYKHFYFYPFYNIFFILSSVGRSVSLFFILTRISTTRTCVPNTIPSTPGSSLNVVVRAYSMPKAARGKFLGVYVPSSSTYRIS